MARQIQSTPLSSFNMVTWFLASTRDCHKEGKGHSKTCIHTSSPKCHPETRTQHTYPGQKGRATVYCPPSTKSPKLLFLLRKRSSTELTLDPSCLKENDHTQNSYRHKPGRAGQALRSQSTTLRIHCASHKTANSNPGAETALRKAIHNPLRSIKRDWNRPAARQNETPSRSRTSQRPPARASPTSFAEGSEKRPSDEDETHTSHKTACDNSQREKSPRAEENAHEDSLHQDDVF